MQEERRSQSIDTLKGQPLMHAIGKTSVIAELECRVVAVATMWLWFDVCTVEGEPGPEGLE